LITSGAASRETIPDAATAEGIEPPDGIEGSMTGEVGPLAAWSEGASEDLFQAEVVLVESKVTLFFFLAAWRLAVRSRRPLTRARSFFMSILLPMISAKL